MHGETMKNIYARLLTVTEKFAVDLAVCAG